MCGIVGGVSDRNVLPILIEGLKRLEYRGYDSAGVAFRENSKISLIKAKGRVLDLENKLPEKKIKSNQGIAHTRWATHGVPSEKNAHPQISENKIFVVHNGIIENHLNLREKLQSEGVKFRSDTDTEVVAHLINLHMQKGMDFDSATLKAISQLKGAYALAVIDKDNPDLIIGARNQSPLVIGEGYDENFVASALFGTLHEAGHGIYDQGLRTEQYGLPPGSYVSLGIHESQSRMWENFVGRSRAFWQHFFPTAQAAFPDALSGVSLDEFFFAVNGVSPSLIRVEADEATYNLHIIIRFELEQALVSGDLRVADLPQAWNEKYQTYLGIAPPSNADGVLQDIHWGAALFGYFPTYSLGNLYAAQFFDKADQELGGLQSQFAQGEFAPLKQWLNENIHQPGQCYTATELLEKTVGAPLHHDALMQHLQAKLAPLYGLS